MSHGVLTSPPGEVGYNVKDRSHYFQLLVELDIQYDLLGQPKADFNSKPPARGLMRAHAGLQSALKASPKP